MLKKINFRNRKFLGILSIVLALLLVVGVVSIISFSKPKETIEIESSNFVVGKISSKGEFISSDDYLITKDLINCDGLTIEPSYNAKSKFQVFFYDFGFKFIYCTEVLNENYVFLDSVPFVEYCRIMILPDRDGKTAEDFKVNIFNKSKFIEEFKITTNKEQEVVSYKDYFVEDVDLKNMCVEANWTEHKVMYTELKDIGVCKVDLSNYKYLYFVTNTLSPDVLCVGFFLSGDLISKHIEHSEFTYFNGFYIYRMDCSIYTSIEFNYSLGSECHLYLI